MKILAIHNFHRKGSVSGDDQVFKNETKLLEEYENEVIRYTVSNDEFDQKRAVQKFFAVSGMLWSYKNYREVRRIIRAENPDIIHIHTFFPLLSTSVLYAAKRSGKKVVATLHDMRFVCPCATALRNLQLCTECKDGHYFRMCRYGCFKKSKIKSIPVAVIFKYHRFRRSFYRQIDRYICLNESQIKMLEECGFCKDKIVKKYNFLSDIKKDMPVAGRTELPERYVVFWGRIGEEKGISVLMKIWDKLPKIPLVIMGTGPLEEKLRVWADGHGHVFFVGYTAYEECLAIVKGGQFAVFPSVWDEGCPMVEIEAECLGKALVASDLGFSSEMIENGINGIKVKSGDIDGFVENIKRLWNDPVQCRELGRGARKIYEAKFTSPDNYRQLMEIYRTALGYSPQSAGKLVSVIIPAYQAEKTLESALASVCGQTYRNLEIIVVDDGSSDGTQAIAETMQKSDPRITVRRVEHSGVSSARNFALQICQGSFAAFMDADDIMEENMIENLVQHMTDDVDLVCCGYKAKDPGGKILFRQKPVEGLWGYDNLWSAIDMLQSRKCLNMLWNKLFRMSIIRGHNLKMDPRVSMGEDFLFVTGYLKQCTNNIRVILKSDYYYTLSDRGLSSAADREGGLRRRLHQLGKLHELYRERKYPEKGICMEILRCFYTSVMEAEDPEGVLREINHTDEYEFVCGKAYQYGIKYRVFLRLLKFQNAGLVVWAVKIFRFVRRDFVVRFRKQ